MLIIYLLTIKIKNDRLKMLLNLINNKNIKY